MLLSSLSYCFSCFSFPLRTNILYTVEAMMRCCSANTSQIALSLSKIKNTSFKASDMAVYRLLSNVKFQIDDTLWRCYCKVIFNMLLESSRLKEGDKLYIKIDFTSDRDDFLILTASIVISNIAIPIYFSMRKYPKKSGQYDHKKMEKAFIKALKHILSSKYQYVIVADRGFGHQRFIEYCEQCGFEYLLRLKSKIRVKYEENEGLLKEIIRKSDIFDVYIESWQKNATIIRNQKDNKEWYLVSNIKGLTYKKAVQIYKNRFKIEKIFQDLKSSGFDIENVKIQKYDRFKRLLFLSMLSYSIMILLGDFINNKLPSIKKKLTNIYKPFNSIFKLSAKILREYPRKAYKYIKKIINL